MIVLTHCAHAVWEGSHQGSWHLYGHSHATAEKALNDFMPGRRSIDVGVDNAFIVFGEYRPIAFDEINEIFQQLPGNSIDKGRIQ